MRSLAASLLLLGSAHAEPPLIEQFRLDLTPAEVLSGVALQSCSVATQAYLYLLPSFLHLRQLGEFIKGREHMSPGETPLGGWVIVRDLSTPETTNTMPNVDTLYGASYVWLEKQGPVVLSVPRIDERYYSVAIHDAWFNAIDVVGTRTNGGKEESCLIVPAGWNGEKPEGIARVIRASTAVVNLYQRIYLRAGDDLAAIRKLQDQIRLSPLASWKQPGAKFPAVDDNAFRLPALRDTRDPLRFFEVTNDYAALNGTPPADASLMALFKPAGIGPGARLPEPAELREALVKGAADAQSIINADISAGPYRNGWRVPDPNNAMPGPHSLDRSVAQLIHIGVLPSEEAMYYVSFRDGSGEALDGNRPNRLVFPKGQLPPVGEQGFWSLTMYDERSLLVENPISRYVIRPDTGGLKLAEDESLTIYLQHEKPADAPAGNWLPAPQGNFIVALRCYLPRPEALSGAWFPPAISHQP